MVPVHAAEDIDSLLGNFPVYCSLQIPGTYRLDFVYSYIEVVLLEVANYTIPVLLGQPGAGESEHPDSHLAGTALAENISLAEVGMFPEVHWRYLRESTGTDVRDEMSFEEGIELEFGDVGEEIPDRCLLKTVGVLNDLQNLAQTRLIVGPYYRNWLVLGDRESLRSLPHLTEWHWVDYVGSARCKALIDPTVDAEGVPVVEVGLGKYRDSIL